MLPICLAFFEKVEMIMLGFLRGGEFATLPKKNKIYC
jgi:hypothetical protein